MYTAYTKKLVFMRAGGVLQGGLPTDLQVGGSAMDGNMTDGNILRRTITMGAPQQVHSSWGRGAGGVGGAAGCLNTSALLRVAASSNISIGTDPHLQQAALPQSVVVR